MSRGEFAGNRGQGMHWIRDAKRARIYARDGYCCLYCGKPAKTLSLDHVLPRPKGGNEATNLATACLDCNSVKGHLSLLEFAFQFCAEPHEVIERVLAQIERPL